MVTSGVWLMPKAALFCLETPLSLEGSLDPVL